MPVAGGPKITKTGILLDVDAADKQSYPGSGTTWTNNARLGYNNGTLNNISFDSNDSKGALIFTGSNTYVDFGNIGDLSSAWSFQVAFKPAPTSSGDAYTILSYASGSDTGSLTFKLDYSSSTQEVILSTFSTASATAETVHAFSASVASGSWNIVHGTYGSQLAALYVNGLGQVYQPTTGSSVGYNASNQLYAGGTYGLDSGFYTGSMANVTVNNADLAGLDVNKNYNAIATRFSLPIRRSTITDADAFNFVEAAGISDETQAAAINTLVSGLKSNSLWTKMLAIYPLIGASAYSTKFNLKDPTLYNVEWYGAIDHDLNGVTFTNGYGNCGVRPADTGDKDDFHFSVYTRNIGSGTFGYIGSVNRGNPYYTEMNWFGGSNYHHINSGNAGVSLVSNTAGSILMTRTSPSLTVGYNNGTQTNTRSISSTGASTQQIRLNSNGNTSGINLAFATVGFKMTATDAANLHTVVLAYQTALGRQV